jgi:hypothetical protein
LIIDDKELFELLFLLSFAFAISFPSAETRFPSRVLWDFAACSLGFLCNNNIFFITCGNAFRFDVFSFCEDVFLLKPPNGPLTELVLISSVES